MSTLKDHLDDAAGRATEGRLLDPRATAAGAAARAGRRTTRRAGTGVGLLAAAAVAVAVAVLPGTGDLLRDAAPALAPAEAVGRSAGSALAPELLVAGVVAGLLVAALVGRRSGPAAAVAVACVVVAAGLAALPAALSSTVVSWTRAHAGTFGGASVVPDVVSTSQRAAPPAAFDAPGEPRTTRVSLVLRATVAGREGLYGVDADSGGLVDLDRLAPDHPWRGIEEVAVSPSGRYVVWATPGDDRHTGTGAGAAVVDLRAARVRSVPLLQPPGPSAGGLRASTSLAVLDDGSLVVVRQGNGSLWLYPRDGGRVELPSFGAVLGVAPLPGDRFAVRRDGRFDVVDARSRRSVAWGAVPGPAPDGSGGDGAAGWAAAWTSAGLVTVTGDDRVVVVPMATTGTARPPSASRGTGVVLVPLPPEDAGVTLDVVGAADRWTFALVPDPAAGVVTPAPGDVPTLVARPDEPVWTVLEPVRPGLYPAAAGLVLLAAAVAGRSRQRLISAGRRPVERAM